MAFRIEQRLVGPNEDIIATKIAWESEPITISADAAVSALSDTGEQKTAKDEAIQFLSNELAAGPVPAGEIGKRAGAAGITSKPLRAAKSELGIKSAKDSFDGGWKWSLPPKMPSHPQDALQTGRAPSPSEGALDDETTLHFERITQ